MSHFDVTTAFLWGESGTIMRRYQASLDSNNNPCYVWGGGTYNVAESIKVQRPRLTQWIVDEQRYGMDDMICYLKGATVAVLHDRVKVAAGTFEIDAIRPIVVENATVGKEAFIKKV